MATCIVDTPEVENETRMCDGCKRVNETTLASSWCRDCKDALCDQCVTFHRRIRSSAKHQTVPLQDLTEDELAVSSLEIDTNCPSHHDHPLAMYCKSHDELCCVVCACTTHKDCKSLEPLDELAENSTEKITLDAKSSEYLKIAATIQKSVDERIVVLVDLDKDKESISSRVDTFVGKVENKLRQLHSEFNATLQDQHNCERVLQENTLKMLLEFKESVERCANITQNLCHLKPHEALIKSDQMQREITEQFTKVDNTFQSDSSAKARLVLNDNSAMRNILDSVSSIGVIEKTRTHKGTPTEIKSIDKSIKSLHIRSGITTKAQVPVPAFRDLMSANVRLRKVVSWEDLDITARPWFTDGLYTNSTNLLLVDHNKNRLVMFNENFEQTREILLGAKPSCAAVSNDKKNLFAVCNANSILRYPFPDLEEGTMMLGGMVDAWGINVCRDNILTGHVGHIAIRDEQGNQKSKIEITGDSKSMASSTNNNLFCHQSGDTVVGRNKNHDIIWRFHSKKLKDLRGLCYDRFDNVYAVGRVSRNVHQISADGTKQRILITQTSKIAKPYAIVFHPTRDLFIVTSFREEVAFEVYEFTTKN